MARAAPESGPKRAIAVATASSQRLLAPISAPGAAMADSLYPLLKLMRLRADGMSFLSAANGATDGTPKDAVQEEEL